MAKVEVVRGRNRNVPCWMERLLNCVADPPTTSAPRPDLMITWDVVIAPAHFLLLAQSPHPTLSSNPASARSSSEDQPRSSAISPSNKAHCDSSRVQLPLLPSPPPFT